MKPIPKSMLIHEVMHHKKVSGSSFYDEVSLDKGTLLKRVRIEPSFRIIRDKNNAEVQLAAALFYDCRNSQPRDLVFAVDDVIIFNGTQHQVKTVEPLYDGRRLHHYELGMVRYG